MSDTIKVRPVIAGYTTGGLRVGEQVQVWGHTFTLGKDRVLTCDMIESLARVEMKAGRVVPIMTVEAAKKTPKLIVEDYYADAEDFKKRIAELSIFDLQNFTNENFKFTWPKNTAKETMIEKICTAIEDMRDK